MDIDRKAQAELRRKRILANAEARLRKITGKDQVEVPKVPGDGIISHPANGHIHNGSCSAEEAEEVIFPTSLEIPSISSPREEEEEINSRVNELSSLSCNEFPKISAEDSSKKSNNDPKLQWCFYLFLGLIIRILIYFEFSQIFLNNILGPFAVVCIPRLTWRLYKGETQSSGLFAFACLAGPHQEKVQLFLTIILTSRLMLQYLALYLFSFILTDSILEIRNS